MILRIVRLFAIALIFSVALIGLGGNRAHADVTDFTVVRFEADYTLTRHDKQGEMRVVENILVDFTDNNHGILRALPTKYKGHSLKLHINSVTLPTGAPNQYTTSVSNGNLILKIGDPSKTVTGAQGYIIDYTVRNVIGFYDDHDELYWDINGDQWQQPVWSASATLHMPAGTVLDSKAPICYAGGYGDKARECEIAFAGTDQKITARTTTQLEPGETLSIIVGFKPGYFSPTTWLETLKESAGAIASFFIPCLLLGGSAAVLWFMKGRDPKGKGTIVPQYDAPDNLKPIDVGTLMDFKTDSRDITATIIDLAIRGYMTIIEDVTKRVLRRDLTTYRLRLEKTDFKGLDPRERELLTNLFPTKEKGQEIQLADLKYKFVKVATKLRKDTKQLLLTGGYYQTRFSSLFGVGALGSTSIVFLFLFIFGAAHGWLYFGTIVGAIIAACFVAALPSRTAKGVAAKEHTEGLKLYLETAEEDRLKMLQSPSSPYAHHGAEPQRTVHLFEKLLPYAMVLGVEKEWAKQFEHIYASSPDWYGGNFHAFNAAYLATSLSSSMQGSVNAAFSSSNNSSSSGFGGGGFSGGGGGGGGGSGW